jgi:hypothetical protein
MISEFLKTMRHAPCAQDTTFAEFYSRFQEWLPGERWRWQWPEAETRKELSKRLELFRGVRNVLMLVDHSFQFAYDYVADEGKMARERGNACWIEDGAAGFWAFREEIWKRVTIQSLIQQLGWRGLNAEEIYRLRIEWRADPISLHDLIEAS